MTCITKTFGIMTIDAVEQHLRGKIPPFNFSSAKDCLTALKQVRQEFIGAGVAQRFGQTPLSFQAVDEIMSQIEKTPPESKKERRRRSNIHTRLRKLAKVVTDAPVWDDFTTAFAEIAAAEGLASQKQIPVLNTLKAVALENALEPKDMTTVWLADRMQSATKKRRESLRDAAALVDRFHARLPPGLRPPELFGDLADKGGGHRRSAALLSGLTIDVFLYMEMRMTGVTAEGLNPKRPVTLKSGISPKTASMFDQSFAWFLDSLRAGGVITAETMPKTLQEFARLDWLAKVAFQALDDYAAAQDGTATHLPWKPIAPNTILSRLKPLRKMFGDINPDFKKQTFPKSVGYGRVEEMTVKEVVGHVRDWADGNGMTPKHRRFCLDLIHDPDRQKFLLNMHTICWQEAQEVWERWSTLDKVAKRAAIDLCTLAAMLAIVVHYPLRAGTVTGLTFGGDTPDVTLPADKNTIMLSISSERMKNNVVFEGIIDDTAINQPHKIMEWFITGPRKALLSDASLLAEHLRRPDQLFAGFDTDRYGPVLSEWTETRGMRMTTHVFRHAIATILVNICGVVLEEVAHLLGDKSVETVRRHYVFNDLVRRRSEALKQLEERRQHLEDIRHPGRQRAR